MSRRYRSRGLVSTGFLTVERQLIRNLREKQRLTALVFHRLGPKEACFRVRAACNGDLSTAFRASPSTSIGRVPVGRVRSLPSLATPETITPTRPMRAAALAERLRLLRELRRLDDRHAALVLELEEVGATRDSLREDIRVLARHSDEDELRPQPDVVRSATATAHAARLFEPREVLRGMRVREVAARLMAMREDPGTSRSTMSTSTNCSPATASRSPADDGRATLRRNSVDPP